ncbi:MAG: hypothetical protein DMG86_04620 [Acidobacteria bacterium]|nr:MAG: hypothetical protein DMG86_04620 [Acidobacteriota bacterium]
MTRIADGKRGQASLSPRQARGALPPARDPILLRTPADASMGGHASLGEVIRPLHVRGTQDRGHDADYSLAPFVHG